WTRSDEVGAALLLSTPVLLLLLALTLLGVGLGSGYLVRRWQPVLARLDGALAALAAGTFQRVEVGNAADAPRRIAESYNRAVGELQQRLSAQACLAEVDRLLLEAHELEQT